MVAQQHKVMRQVLELEIRDCPRDAAQSIQSELLKAYDEHLLPLIDEICSERSTPGRIHRVDRLEIDLGEVSFETFEAALADRFAPTFRHQLGEAIDDAPEVDSDLELFDYFIRTGAVPWWVDASDGSVLQGALESLLRLAPQALRPTILAAPDDERTRRRIVRAYSDRLLDQLVAALAPQWSAACPGLGGAWITVLGSQRRGQGDSSRAERHFVWEEILRAAMAKDVPAAEAQPFFGALLVRVAHRMRLVYRSLLAELHGALADGSVSVPPWTREITEALWRETGGNLARTRVAAPPGESARAHFVRLLKRLEPVALPEADLWARLGRVFGQLPQRLQAQAIEAFATVSDGEVLALNSRMIDALAALVRAALGQQLLAPGLVERYATRLRQSAAPGMPAAVSSEMGAKLLNAIGVPVFSAQREDEQVDSAVSDAKASAAPPGESARAGFLRLLERLESASASEADLWTRLGGMFGRLPPRLQAQAIEACAAVRDGEVLALNSRMIDALAALVRAALEQQLLAPGLVERYATRLRQSAAPGMPAAISSEMGAKLLDAIGVPAPRAQRDDEQVDSAVSDAETSVGPPGESARAGFLRLLERLESASASEADLWTRLGGMFGRLPPRLQAQAIEACAAVSDGEILALNSRMIDALAALVRAALEQQLLAPGLVERYATRLRQSAAPGMPAAVSSELGAKLLDAIGVPAPRAQRDDECERRCEFPLNWAV